MENLIKVGGSTSNGILLSRGIVKIRLILKDEIEKLILILTNFFYVPNSPSNLVSLGFLNNTRIYYHNKDQILYDLKIQKTFIFAK